MLKMGCICCVMNMGFPLELIPTYPSELERAQSCLLTQSKLGFPLQSPSWHPVLILHGIFHNCELYICGRSTAADSFFFHQEEVGSCVLLLNLGRLPDNEANRTWQTL